MKGRYLVQMSALPEYNLAVYDTVLGTVIAQFVNAEDAYIFIAALQFAIAIEGPNT